MNKYLNQLKCLGQFNKLSCNNGKLCLKEFFIYSFTLIFRRNTGSMALSSSRLGTSKRGSLQPGGNGSGDDSTTQDETLDGDDTPI